MKKCTNCGLELRKTEGYDPENPEKDGTIWLTCPQHYRNPDCDEKRA